MIERLRDYKAKLRVDGQIQHFNVTALTPSGAKLEATRRARRLWESDLIEVERVEAKLYKPYV